METYWTLKNTFDQRYLIDYSIDSAGMQAHWGFTDMYLRVKIPNKEMAFWLRSQLEDKRDIKVFKVKPKLKTRQIALDDFKVKKEKITIREVGNGVKQNYNASISAVEAPTDIYQFKTITHALVTNGEIAYIGNDNKISIKTSQSKQLGEFSSGDRCLIMSDLLNKKGRPLWKLVELV